MELKSSEIRFEPEMMPSEWEEGSDTSGSVVEEEWSDPTESAGTTADLSFSGFSENWDSTDNLDARILEVRDNRVKLDVLLDRERRQFEERLYPRQLLEGAVNIEVGKYVLIRIFRAQGKIKFTFHNGDGIVDKKMFEDMSRFRDLDEIDFDTVL
jgi:hypothetical protein